MLVEELLGLVSDGPGGVDVAVGDKAAVVASEDPLAEGQRGFPRGAGLR